MLYRDSCQSSAASTPCAARRSLALDRIAPSLLRFDFFHAVFGVQDGVVGIWDGIFGIWNDIFVFVIQDGVFDIWDGVFGIWD